MMSRRLLLTLALVLAPALNSAADIGVVILEPVKALGFFTRVGHAGTYLSNICPDGSPVRPRLCRPPLITTPALHRAMQASGFESVFSAALTRRADGQLPVGQWKTGMANRIDRSIYILSVATAAADDLAIVEAFNAAPNKSRFNFFYDNCSNQTKAVFDLIMSERTPSAIA